MLHSILLVEDNPADLDLTRRAFQRHQAAYPLQEAHDGAEALEMVARLQSDESGANLPLLVLLDLRLPKVNGFEVLRQLKSNPKTCHVPVVVLTSSSDHSDIQHAYTLGANSYLIKPINYHEFSEMAATIDQYWMGINVPFE